MNRRLRKRFHIGEFREMVFRVQFNAPAPHTEEAQDPFWHRMIDWVESHGYGIGGGSGVKEWDVVVSALAGRGSMTSADQEVFRVRLPVDLGVTGLEIGPLFDGWHEDDTPAAWFRNGRPTHRPRHWKR